MSNQAITAFICGKGSKPTHKCDQKAEVVGYSDGIWILLTPENREEHKKAPTWSVACSQCGRTAFDDCMFL